MLLGRYEEVVLHFVCDFDERPHDRQLLGRVANFYSSLKSPLPISIGAKRPRREALSCGLVLRLKTSLLRA